jgi:exodeoxyribonuclease-3
MMKIASYNVNGIRSALNKGFSTWLSEENPDIVCLQEVKALENQVDIAIFHDLGYQVYWYPAEKKGYSGVAILSKIKPQHVEYGMGHPLYDAEGRIIRADFKDFSVMSAYFPSGSSGDERQAVKMAFLDDFYGYSKDILQSHPGLIISGDYNICHQPIDIHNPVANKNSSGFLPEERAWMSKFLEEGGFVDSFRHFYDDPHRYTWWSFRARAREKNLGWRIDYHMVSKALEARLADAAIQSDAVHSDHCPIFLKIK